MAASKNEKNKIIIIGALVLVMLGVGAFQLTKAPEPVGADIKKDEEAKIAKAVGAGSAVTIDGMSPAGESLVATLPQHDPFTPRILDPSVVKARELQVQQAKEHKEAEARAAAETAKLAAESKLAASNSHVSPMDPNGKIGPLPNTTANLSGNPESIQAAVPSFKLTGVILGDRPMAVLKDMNGRQKLVRVGDKVLDERVIVISKGKIVLQGQGQKRVLTL